MNELKFLEAFGTINDDLIREADIDIEKQHNTKTAVSGRKIYTFGSIAAAAVIAVSIAVICNAHKPSELLIKNSSVLTDNSDDYQPENNDNNVVIPASKTTGYTQKTTVSSETTTVKSTDISDLTEYENTDAPIVSDNSVQQTTPEERIYTPNENNSSGDSPASFAEKIMKRAQEAGIDVEED